MLSAEDNDLLCRVGPGTPMGNLMREYWLPCLPSAEFPEPDCPPKRMRLLGENFVMFRDSEGRMGALAEACPHRGASLYFGRNEECGLRCPYHGWKFDLEGNCVDMPTEPAGSNFKRKVRARAYPCVDVNHMVWVYMGEREEPPPFPRFEVNTLPENHVAPPNIMMEQANWVQNMEGDLDSAHLDWVHKRLSKDAPPPPIGTHGFWNPDPNPPRLDVVKTDYGAHYTSMRDMADGTDWHRINQFIFPCHTMITVGPVLNLRSFVPLDDHHAMLITHSYDPVNPIPKAMAESMPNSFDVVDGYIDRTNDPRTYFMTKANKTNDYYRDLDVQRDRMFCGIPFVMNLPDRAMTELMCGSDGEPLYDRTQEHLGTSDVMVIAVRQQLIKAAKTLRDSGELPANVRCSDINRVRAGSFLLEKDADWKALTREALVTDSDAPVGADVPLIIE